MANKQLFIIAGAVVAGIVAVFLTSNYIKSSIENQTAILADQYNTKQKEMVAQLQQRSDQQMAALAQEVQRMKAEQAQAMQKQMAALQTAQMMRSQPNAPVVSMVPKPSLALRTPRGKRAVTVMIDSLAAVGGLLNAGDHVDVIAQLNVPSQDPDKKTVTAMIFQDLQVLAINTNLNQPGAYDMQQSANFLKITFAVDPQEAGLLAFANKNGSLELALRASKESMRRMVKADTWKTLTDYVLKNQGPNLLDPDGEGASKPSGHKPEIEIFRGGKEL